MIWNEQDKHDGLNNMNTGIWTSWKYAARLYSISTVPWSKWGFLCDLSLPTVEMQPASFCQAYGSLCMCVCVCVCVRKANRAGFTAHSQLISLLQCTTHQQIPLQRRNKLFLSERKEKIWPATEKGASSEESAHMVGRSEVCMYEISSQMRSDTRMRSCQTQWHGCHNETARRDGGSQMNRAWRARERQTILIETGTWWQIERRGMCVHGCAGLCVHCRAVPSRLHVLINGRVAAWRSH